MNELRNDAESLKLAFPEISLGMETDQLRNSLTNRLKLRATVTAAFEFPKSARNCVDLWFKTA